MTHERILDPDDFESRLRGDRGNINGPDSKVIWWAMGIFGLIVATFAVTSWLSLQNRVDAIGEKLAAMDAKLTLVLDGRIKDPNAKP